MSHRTRSIVIAGTFTHDLTPQAKQLINAKYIGCAEPDVIVMSVPSFIGSGKGRLVLTVMVVIFVFIPLYFKRVVLFSVLLSYTPSKVVGEANHAVDFALKQPCT